MEYINIFVMGVSSEFFPGQSEGGILRWNSSWISCASHTSQHSENNAVANTKEQREWEKFKDDGDYERYDGDTKDVVTVE